MQAGSDWEIVYFAMALVVSLAFVLLYTRSVILEIECHYHGRNTIVERSTKCIVKSEFHRRFELKIFGFLKTQRIFILFQVICRISGFAFRY